MLTRLYCKDFSKAICSGFEATGHCPLNVERPLARLPEANRNFQSEVEQLLLDKLSQIRYNPVPAWRATMPKKDKLPAGKSYTCPAKKARIGDDSDSSSASDSDSESDEEERRVTVKKIVRSLQA